MQSIKIDLSIIHHIPYHITDRSTIQSGRYIYHLCVSWSVQCRMKLHLWNNNQKRPARGARTAAKDPRFRRLIPPAWFWDEPSRLILHDHAGRVRAYKIQSVTKWALIARTSAARRLGEPWVGPCRRGFLVSFFYRACVDFPV